LADAQDLGSCVLGRGSSSLPTRTAGPDQDSDECAETATTAVITATGASGAPESGSRSGEVGEEIADGLGDLLGLLDEQGVTGGGHDQQAGPGDCCVHFPGMGDSPVRG
jgi:hypothetical protein